MTMNRAEARRTIESLNAVGSPVERDVGRPVPERAAFLAQFEACRREVASWPDWMRQERTAPAWMLGWDD